MSALTRGEAGAVEYYTGSGFTEINSALRRGEIGSVQTTVAGVDKALAKLPKVEGTVFRTVDFNHPADLAKFLSSRSVGTTITEPTYLSASQGSWYGGEFGGNTRINITIVSKTGRALSAISQNPSESEVLFARGSRFEIISVEKGAGKFGETLIRMREISPAETAVNAAVKDTMRGLSATESRVVIVVEKAYQEAITAALEQERLVLGTAADYASASRRGVEAVRSGKFTRLQGSQRVLDDFASKGITGFVDKAGRGWSLESYSEMAVRTGTGQAALQGHMDRLQENGLDLVIISDAPRECHLCAPWEGKVLSISGKDLEHPSLESARSAGLFHCNCRHSASLYQEGVTPPMHAKADPEGYRAGQRQRYLERKIREQKRLEAAALDEQARKAAQAKIRATQKALREHIAANELKRLPYREQIGRAI